VDLATPLAKLHIQPLQPVGEGFEPSSLPAFDVPFNPTSYKIIKPVSWRSPAPAAGPASGATSPTGAHATAGSNRELDAPLVEFDGGGGRTLTLDLFFDVTEGGADGKTLDVRVQTNQIVALTRIERKNSGQKCGPPVCEISWGPQPPESPGVPFVSDLPFFGVVTNLTQDFLMFRPSGEPVRARLSVTFSEYNLPKKNKQENDPDLTTHRITRGDTLSAIAARYYSDPGQWRVIAAANAIDDPRRLQIGQSLAIPQLR
jgi:hypothetical protein